MGGFYGAPQAVFGDVSVDLGRGNIRMAQEGLHAPEVGAALDQMGGEGMSQNMRRQAVRIEAGF